MSYHSNITNLGTLNVVNEEVLSKRHLIPRNKLNPVIVNDYILYTEYIKIKYLKIHFTKIKMIQALRDDMKNVIMTINMTKK